MKSKRHLHADWHRGALASESCRLERTLPIAALTIPEDLHLNADCIVWNVKRRAMRPAKPHEGMLTNFIALAEADATEILNYARKWGVLGTCRHNVPSSHNRPAGFLGSS